MVNDDYDLIVTGFGSSISDIRHHVLAPRDVGWDGTYGTDNYSFPILPCTAYVAQRFNGQLRIMNQSCLWFSQSSLGDVSEEG